MALLRSLFHPLVLMLCLPSLWFYPCPLVRPILCLVQLTPICTTTFQCAAYSSPLRWRQ
jgi:hypothetical protein